LTVLSVLFSISGNSGSAIPNLTQTSRLPESRMRKKIEIIAIALLVQVVLPGATCQSRAKAEKVPYQDMASLGEYLMPDQDSEIALARSAAPASEPKCWCWDRKDTRPQ